MKSAISMLVFLGLLFSLGHVSSAQILPQPLSLVASPVSPSPGETVTVQAATPSFDKNTAYFSWSVEGKARPDLSGDGKDSISLIAGSVGSTVRVSVTVSKIQGGAKSASFTIRVSDLALSWFAETYVPKWYKGKALPVQNSVVNIIAVPQIVISGKRISAENLIYRWSLDDEEKALVGVGKQTFRMRTSDLPKSTQRVEVVVEDQGRLVRKTGTIFITPAVPKVAVYPSSPLGGVEYRSAPPFFVTSRPGLLDFLAEPFFFSVASRRNLIFRWSVGGKETVGAPENPFLLTLDNSAGPTGVVPLSVSADDKDDLVPAANGAVTVLSP